MNSRQGVSWQRLFSIVLFVGTFSLATNLQSPLQTHAVEEDRTATNGANWPLFRGNPAGTGVATSTLPEDLELLWEFRTEDSLFAATAAIVEDTIYLGDADKWFYAIELETGRKKWSHEVEMGFLGSAAVRDGRVFVGDSDGIFYCLDAKTGNVLWKQETEAEINSSPNFYKDSVLIGSQDGSLYRFRMSDGSIIWKYTIEASGGIQCSPTLGGHHAFICGCDGKLHVIDVETGSSVETIEIGDPTLSTPAVLESNVYFGTEGATLFDVNWQKAKIIWRYQNSRQRTSYRSSPAVSDRGIVIGGRNKLVELIDRSGQRDWSFPTKGRIDSSPVIVDNRVFIGSADGRLYGLNLETGDKVWSYDGGAAFNASPAVAQGRLVIGNDDGVLYCFGQNRTE